MNNLLFDVPRNRTRLEIAMEKHTIHTLRSPGMGPGLDWLAVLMKPVWQMGYGVKEGIDIVECYAHVGRLIDEGDFSGYGDTEEEAVLDVCRKNQIQIVL